MDETLSQALAAVLRAERATRRWTVGELAEQAGMTKVDLYRKLRGERELNTAEYVKIARAFGVTVSELIHKAEARIAQMHEDGHGHEVISFPKE